ncbi:integrase catalytic domain-containing protein [Trichonephila clavipes]|nr:integrase catalytic domain-containing protein [Trichonephila clavipes]
MPLGRDTSVLASFITKRVFVLFCKDNWYQKKTLVDNSKRAILEAKHVNEFRPDDVLWEKISKGLLRNPDRPLKNTDKRMVYIYNMFFVKKKDFTFGFRTVKSGEIHLIQTTNVPILIYELPSSSLRCRANPNLFRRSFEPFDQMLYHRMVLEPHTAYPIPARTRYILLTVQKTLFGLDIIPEMILPQLMENGFKGSYTF